MAGGLAPQEAPQQTEPLREDILSQQLPMTQNPALEINEGQQMQPDDPDRFRMYWVRELDDTWTQRNRVTIDSGDLGRIKWYAMHGGIFYAVVQSD